MDEKEENSKIPGPPQIIRPMPIPSAEAFGTPTIWLSYCFAPEWFADALNEAKAGRDHHARRREILFAVCFAESYLVEWVRDEVLNRDFDRLGQFFPPGERRGVSDKWRDVPKVLLANGLIPAVPDLGRLYWRDWLELVDLRNGLIHARSSRAETNPQPSEERPRPSKSELDKLEPGWAAQVVATLVRELHTAVRTQAPGWLVML